MQAISFVEDKSKEGSLINNIAIYRNMPTSLTLTVQNSNFKYGSNNLIQM